MTKREAKKLIDLHNGLLKKYEGITKELSDGIVLHEYSDQDAVRHAIECQRVCHKAMMAIRDVLGKKAEETQKGGGK